MVTNYAQQVLTQFGREGTGAALVSRALTGFSRLLCGMRGHDPVMHFEAKRVTMRCTSCGHDSPGWEITDRGPRRRFEGDAQRHLLKSGRRVV